ncbi:MAG TPA: flagellar basal-body MS-ring/collar protein FliF [Halanaerobiales bacterium]|nr:flagellar basal-body MS-ring/collar protein FliF [Halanaerobiales bacterium]
MWDSLTDYIEKLKELWDNLDGQAKIVIGAGTILMLAVFGYLIVTGNSTVYTPLYTDVVQEDAGKIVNSLKEKNIPYRLTNNGSTIEVPEAQVHQARIDLASEGLPHQGVVGFEIFDQSSFGTTDFERKVNYYRAVGGELSRSIKVMRGVEYAKVQITAPKDSLYLDEQQSASASVLLQLNSGYRMSSAQVNSITSLVASSVQDMTPNNVTVIDTGGNLLSAESNGNNMNSQVSQENMEIQNNFENGLEKDLQRLLTKVLGPNNFSVNVSAKLNFDQREVESTTYTPIADGEGIIRSEEVIEETNDVTSNNNGGAAGTESNIPEYQAEGNAAQSSQSEKSNTVTNYEINQKIERQVYAGGGVERLTVSVMVDGEQEPALLNKIEESVQTAIGYNPERGDQVSVNSFNFDNSLEQEIAQAKEAEASAERNRMYIYGGLIVLIIIILSLIIFFVRRSMSSKTAEQTVQRGQMVDYQAGQGGRAEESEEFSRPSLSEEERKKKQLTEDLEDIVSDQPEDVAKLLKNWLMED